MWIWALWVVGAAIGAILSAPGALGQPGAEPAPLPGASAQGAMLENRELAWILANNDETVPSAPLTLRRITAKSVFLAPTFTSSCSEGYRQDALGRCVKVVKLNQQAQWEYFLQKLNSMYAANQPPVSVPAKDKPPAGPFRLPIPLGDAETTTMLPMTTDESTTMASTQQTTMTPPTTFVSTTEAERGTETPLLIIVANTTEQPESTTDREMLTKATENSDVRTSTELPATMTTLSMQTTTDCDDCSTTTSPSTGGFFFSQSQNGESYETNTAMTSNDDFQTTTTRPSVFRPSAYLPVVGDEYLHYPPTSQEQHNNHVRQSTTTTDRTGNIDSLLRPQGHRFSTTPAPSTLWPEDPLPYGTRLDFSTTYTTRRSTVRFPSERPAIPSAVPTNSYIRFPPIHDSPAPVWWPTHWENQQIHHSQWPPQPQRLGASGRPWASNREPRQSWIHQ